MIQLYAAYECHTLDPETPILKVEERKVYPMPIATKRELVGYTNITQNKL